MLSLTRGIGEEVVITVTEPCRICVAPLAFRGNAVRLGFEAPPSVVINRFEVQEAMDLQSEKEPGIND
jgi:carbon storage regulator CsrA